MSEVKVPEAAVEAAFDVWYNDLAEDWRAVEVADPAWGIDARDHMLGALKLALPHLVADYDARISQMTTDALAADGQLHDALARIKALEEALQMIATLLSGQKSAVAASLMAIARAALEQQP